MTTSATLQSETVQLDPGGEAAIPLQVRNNGDIVEGYEFEVLGPLAPWATVEPSSLSIYPGTEQTATVALRPPKSPGVPAGDLRLGVRIVPTSHPEEAVVPEGVVHVMPFLATTAEITPRTSRGSGGARHQLSVDNRGNMPQTFAITGFDPGEQVRFAINPAVVTVGPGGAAFVDVRLRPFRRLWRGMPVTHQLQVTLRPEHAPAVTLDVSHVQQPTIPSWLPKALLILLALILALAALWYGLLRPEIRDAAEEAVQPKVAQLDKAAADANTAADQAQAATKQANDAAGNADEAAGKADDSVSTVTTILNNSGFPGGPGAVPFTQRIKATPAPRQDAVAEFDVPDDLPDGLIEDDRLFESLRLTDLVLQNPQGDFGRVTLRVSGTDEEAPQDLLSLALENFRDNDYHFVSPIVLTEGQTIELFVECSRPGTPPEAATPPATCDTSAYLGGTIATVPRETPTPTSTAVPSSPTTTQPEGSAQAQGSGR